MSDCRIVLAEDHYIFREGLKHLLEKSSGVKVVGEAKNGKELLAILRETACELVITDIVMPEMDGLSTLKEIKRKYPGLRVLMLSMLNDHAHFEQAKALGASGYLTKDDLGDELLLAIERIRKGKTYVSPSVTTMLGERQLQLMEQTSSPSIEILTHRERQILGLIARGETNKVIAGELQISINTVANHRARLRKKLGLKNSAS